MARTSRSNYRSETTFSSPRTAPNVADASSASIDSLVFTPQAAPGTFFRSPVAGLRLFIPPPARSQARRAARPYTFVSSSLAFQYPKRALVCVRRKQRREVLFARRGTGKGAKAPRRRTHDSSYRC